MKKPSESYLRSVTLLFGDLPLVSEEVAKDIPSKFLKEIGVRGTPQVRIYLSIYIYLPLICYLCLIRLSYQQVNVVFERLRELDWDVKELLKFLTTNEKQLEEKVIGFSYPLSLIMYLTFRSRSSIYYSIRNGNFFSESNFFPVNYLLQPQPLLLR